MNPVNSSPQKIWRRCSSCKKPIPCKTKYFVCSVSTCNGQRTGYVFCSFLCFESHLPGARHREAGAIEKFAPMDQLEGEIPTTVAAREPSRIIVKTNNPSSTKSEMPREVLIIASRLKEYIHARSEFNTSGGVMDVLSDYVRIICDHAIDNARAEGRKTVLDRDFSFLKKI